MKLAKPSLAMLSAALLSACAVGPDYTRPASTLPEHYSHAAVAGAPVTLDRWWRQFHDPELARIVERALAQNLDLAAAMARVEQARAVAHLADAALLPVGEASAQAAGERQSTRSALGEIAGTLPGYQRDQTQYDLGAGASWEIDLFGGLRRQSEADRAEAEAAAAEGAGVRVSIAAEAADAYFRVRAAQASIALREAEVETDRHLLGLISARRQEGLATRGEQAVAEAQLARTVAALPPLRSERQVELNRLDVLMGAQPGRYAAELDGTAAPLTLPSLTALPAPADLLRRRPDVIAAERHLAAADARIGVATAEYYPRLSLSALLGFESLSSAEVSARTFQPQALAGLHWRLFDFGRVDAEVAQAKGARAEALAHYRQAMLRATEDVEDALVAQLQLADARQALQTEVTASGDARAAAGEAYAGGVASLVEVLQQDRGWLAARTRLVQADADTARATVAVFRALGGGW